MNRNGKLNFNFQQYKNFLDTAIKFDNSGYIINEDKNFLIDVPELLIQHFIKNQNKLINFKDVKEFLKESKHWRNLKNIELNNIFFAFFDFNDSNEIDKFHYNCFNIPIELLEDTRLYFIKSSSHLFGFFNSIQDLDIICINTKCDDLFKLLYHELSHYIQIKGNIRIIHGLSEAEIKNKNKLQLMFNIDYDTVFDYFSNKEYIPHINDLIFMLQNTKTRYYNNITNLEFLENIKDFLNVKNRTEMLNHKFLINFKNANKNNYDTLAMLLFSYIAKFKFQQIYKTLKMHFN